MVEHALAGPRLRYSLLPLLICLALAGLATSGLPPRAAERPACDASSMAEAQIAAARGIDLTTLKRLHTNRGLTNQDICAMPQAKLERAIFRVSHPKPDHPDDAAAFRRLQQQDERGVVAPDGLVRAAEHVARMRAAQPPATRAAGIAPQAWQPLGPGNVGGRVRALAVHPARPDTLWLGSASGGVWKSSDGGNSWLPVSDFMANLAVSTLAVDPTNPDLIYAGTGEGFYNSDALRGAGIFTSADGGTTWAQLPATNGADWQYVNKLAIAPTGGTLLAATESGLWRSSNGGVSWTRTSVSRALDVDMHPSNASLAVAGGAFGQAWYSTNGGGIWKIGASFPAAGRVELAYAPSNPSIVYASVDRNGGEVWHSSNGGRSYTLVQSGSYYMGVQGWYDNTIWVDPTNDQRLLVGGIDLWRSSDGGRTLQKISQWWAAPQSAHADQHIIVAHPSFDGRTNTTVYFGNDGGIYKTQNVYSVEGLSGWQSLNNNLGITQFYGAAGSPASGVIVGGTQDNGTLLYRGDTAAWSSMYGGDGGFAAADPSDPNYLYGEYVFLQLHRSSDGGSTAEPIHGVYDHWNGSAWERRCKPAPYCLEDVLGSQALFIAPFILDPNEPQRMLAGGNALWRSEDVRAPLTAQSGPAWRAIKAPGDAISAIAVAQGDSDNLWVGHSSGALFKTASGRADLPAWVRVDGLSSPLPNRFVTRVVIDPREHTRVYATFGGFSADNIWHSSNGGESWRVLTGSGDSALPQVPVRDLAIHPANSAWLYAATEVGIFTSEDSGNSWRPTQDGPANVSVDQLFWMGDTLVAATHGRGLFAARPLLPTPTATPSPTATTQPSQPLATPTATEQATDTPSATVTPEPAAAPTPAQVYLPLVQRP